jgi:hypothetical protein
MEKSLEQIQEEFKKMTDRYREEITTYWDSLASESKKDARYYFMSAIGDDKQMDTASFGEASLAFALDAMINSYRRMKKAILNNES